VQPLNGAAELADALQLEGPLVRRIEAAAHHRLRVERNTNGVSASIQTPSLQRRTRAQLIAALRKASVMCSIHRVHQRVVTRPGPALAVAHG
jgi:hypothetical protein